MSEAKIDGLGKTRLVQPVARELGPKRTIDEKLKIIRDIYHSNVALRAHFEAEPELNTKLGRLMGLGNGSKHWCNENLSGQAALECATLGLPDYVEAIKAEKQKAERFKVQVQFPTWMPDMAGAFPDVPSFLAGDPLNMRRMVNQVNDTRPIRIFVGMASSGYYSAEELGKRGALISALALQLSRTRRVEIYAANCGRHTRKEMDWCGMVKLPLPVSASDLSYWICCQASVRGLLYAFESWKTGTITWPDRVIGHTEIGLKNQADLFGAGPTDIVIPFPYGEDPMILKPEIWMEATLRRVNAIS